MSLLINLSHHPSVSSNPQLDFLDFVARPLFSVISRLLPEVDYMLGALAKNYAFWCSVLAEDQFSK